MFGGETRDETASCSKTQPSLKASVDSRLGGVPPACAGTAFAFFGTGQDGHARRAAPTARDRELRRALSRRALSPGARQSADRGRSKPIRRCGSTARAAGRDSKPLLPDSGMIPRSSFGIGRDRPEDSGS